MPGTGVVIDSRYLDHNPGAGHPERPERIKVLLPMIAAAADVTRIAPRPASGDELALVHDGAYVDEVAATQYKPGFAFDADTPTSPASYETARLAAGGFLALCNSSVRPEVARRNSAIALPSARATSGMRSGPKTISATTRMTSNSGVPMPNMDSVRERSHASEIALRCQMSRRRLPRLQPLLQSRSCPAPAW